MTDAHREYAVATDNGCDDMDMDEEAPKVTGGMSAVEFLASLPRTPRHKLPKIPPMDDDA